MKINCFIFLSICILMAACQKIPVYNGNEIVIKNVTIIPMNENALASTKDISIRGSQIHKISNVTASKNATVIDGTGKYIIPGLAEMHAHIPTPIDGDDTNVSETLFLYLSQGVTTIRGMLGDHYHLSLREKVNTGEIKGPRIYTSSPSMNGNTVDSKAAAKEKVTNYKNDGFDFLKIHPGITLEAWDQLEQTAKLINMDFAGHVPLDVGLHRAISAGYKTIDHLDGFIEALIPTDIEYEKEAGGFFGFDHTGIVDVELIPALVTKIKTNNIAVVPTHTLFTRWYSPESGAAMINQPEMKYMNPETRYNWRQNKDRMISGEGYNETKWSTFTNIRNKILKELNKQGAIILLGSDAPQVMNVPGFSIHHEMQDMVEAGMTPMEVLQSGTIAVAKFFNSLERYGQIKEGMDADIILLNSNPLLNINNARDIEAVIYRGNMLSKTDIEAGLLEIELRHKSEE